MYAFGSHTAYTNTSSVRPDRLYPYTDSRSALCNIHSADGRQSSLWATVPLLPLCTYVGPLKRNNCLHVYTLARRAVNAAAVLPNWWFFRSAPHFVQWKWKATALCMSSPSTRRSAAVCVCARMCSLTDFCFRELYSLHVDISFFSLLTVVYTSRWTALTSCSCRAYTLETLVHVAFVQTQWLRFASSEWLHAKWPVLCCWFNLIHIILG